MKSSTESIWKQFASKLDQFIRSRVAEPATAEDILQDVFMKLHSRLDEFQDEAKLQGWLFLVARNSIIDYYRTRKHTLEVPPSLPDQLFEHQTEENELKAVFHGLIHSLPEPYRNALLLTEFDGLTQKELAKHLNISVSGAKSRVQRAREQLKELLLDYCHREFSRAAGSQPCPKGLVSAVNGKMSLKRRPSRPRRKLRN